MANKTIRSVTYEKRVGKFKIVNDLNGVAKALLNHCDPNSEIFKKAALAILEFDEGTVDQETVRGAFLEAMTAAGILVKGAHEANCNNKRPRDDAPSLTSAQRSSQRHAAIDHERSNDTRADLGEGRLTRSAVPKKGATSRSG
ncbi:hypothetical protein RM190_20105 [Paracoccus sp. CPCC 101403]|uniref:DUF982 domain-containing protein n=1 Tax=Paracoccus broussonetiae TaxID=3075834 RepID=A0ABU3EK73_9RHOB|nr:hypothetical protein [Paracoccus sp. CPCC 101403]MDT1064177.1 hypothetical protein [Paracoccus sp. CPCC 101403]